MPARLFESIVSDIYDAALDPSLWCNALERVSKASGALGAGFVIRNDRDWSVEWVTLYGTEVDALEDYVSYYSKLDPFTSILRANKEKWLRLTDCIATSELSRNEWYNDFICKHGFADILGVQAGRSNYTASFGLLQAANQVPLRNSLVKALEQLISPLRRAAEVQIRLRDNAWRAIAGRLAFDQLEAGYFLLDATGRVLEMNSLAEQLVSLADGLIVRNNQLEAEWPNEAARLAAAIARAVAKPQRGISETVSSEILIRKRESDQGHLLTVTPMGTGLGFIKEPLALVMITDPLGRKSSSTAS